MRSDIVNVTNSGDGTDTALSAASASAIYRGLEKKDAIHLRLLAEEMLGMVRQITGDTEAEFWVESDGMLFELHLLAYPMITGKMRKELLKTSSSGKNEAAKGFMGKIRDIFDRALAIEDVGDSPDYYARGLVLPSDMFMTDQMIYAATANMVTWSMQNYKNTVEDESSHDSAAKEEWDELEKSIVANIADEVKIAISGDRVEMTVYKNFKK